MRYDISFYQDNNGQQQGDLLLSPMTAKSDIVALQAACARANRLNKIHPEVQYKYITIYRYVAQSCRWKTVIDKFKLF